MRSKPIFLHMCLVSFQMAIVNIPMAQVSQVQNLSSAHHEAIAMLGTFISITRGSEELRTIILPTTSSSIQHPYELLNHTCSFSLF